MSLPRVGDIKTHRKPSGQLGRQTYTICAICGKGRWATLQNRSPHITPYRTPPALCQSCARKKSLEEYPEIRERISRTLKELCKQSDILKLRRKAAKVRWDRPDAKEHMSKIQFERCANSPELRARIGRASKEWQNSPEGREKMRLAKIEGHKRHPYSAETKEKIRLSNRKVWENPEYKQRRLKELFVLLQIKPNKLERYVKSVLNRYYPKEWRYTGDGSLVIDGLCPDFVNVNGKKQIIEVFGDYWHGKRVRGYKQTEKGRVKTFEDFGYDTLILWEKDIRKLAKQQLAEKIKDAFGCNMRGI